MKQMRDGVVPGACRSDEPKEKMKHFLRQVRDFWDCANGIKIGRTNIPTKHHSRFIPSHGNIGTANWGDAWLNPVQFIYNFNANRPRTSTIIIIRIATTAKACNRENERDSAERICRSKIDRLQNQFMKTKISHSMSSVTVYRHHSTGYAQTPSPLEEARPAVEAKDAPDLEEEGRLTFFSSDERCKKKKIIFYDRWFLPLFTLQLLYSSSKETPLQADQTREISPNFYIYTLRGSFTCVPPPAS